MKSKLKYVYCVEEEPKELARVFGNLIVSLKMDKVRLVIYTDQIIVVADKEMSKLDSDIFQVLLDKVEEEYQKQKNHK